ncbi:hypothetical protein Bca101_060241 [Brassica carinata]
MARQCERFKSKNLCQLGISTRTFPSPPTSLDGGDLGKTPYLYQGESKQQSSTSGRPK